MLFKELTPIPPAVPDNEKDYDDLKVWLERTLRNLYDMFEDTHDTLGYGDFTEGSIIFADSEGDLAEDNDNLFWNNTNNRLGIGTASPGRHLHLREANPVFRLDDSSGTTVINSVGFIEFGSYNPFWNRYGWIGFGSSIDDALTINNEDGSNIALMGGNVGIGLKTPARSLEILHASAAQLRLTHTATSKYVEFTLDTNSDLTIKPTSTGQIILQPTTDSTDFFQVLDADGGVPIVNVDATNERFGVGLAAPRDTIEVLNRIVFDPTLFNTFIGKDAGLDITTGNYNTALGYEAMTNITDLPNNVVIGYQANYTEASQGIGSDVIIGYKAGYGCSAYSSGGQSVIIGCEAAYTDKSAPGLTAIGYRAAYYINVFAEYCTYIGYKAGYGVVAGNSGDYNTAVGYEALSSIQGGNCNTAVGMWAMKNSAASYYNTAVGYRALEAVTTNGTNNTGIGYLAGLAITTGDGNVAIGSFAMGYNQTGNSNVCVGSGAGSGTGNNSFTGNTFVGTSAGGSATTGTYNVAVGFTAGYENETGTENVAIGKYAGGFAYGGGNHNYNLCAGANAGYALSTGSSNVFLGYQAGYNQLTNSNLLIIDNQDRPLANSEEYRSLIYGLFDADSSNQRVRMNADVTIRNESTMGAESLDETTFATHINWDVVGDFDDTAGYAEYTHNTGAGTLTQTSGDMVLAGVGNRWYKFTYTVSASSGFAGTAQITAAFASAATDLEIVNGTHSTYFKSATTPGDFVISATSPALGFRLDNVSLTELQGGDLVVNGMAYINVASGTTPTPAAEGALFLDTDAGGNGVLKMYANGGWRTVASL